MAIHARRVVVFTAEDTRARRRLSFIDKGKYFFRDLSENFARKVRVERGNAEEAKNEQNTEAGGRCPLPGPTGKAH
jgi:hypothetical protein